MRKGLLILSFVEGAAVMAAELCGAKMLAPVFGSSLYVWASVMGITLAALASGYFYGGKISSISKEVNRTLFQVMLFASVLVLCMPLIEMYLVPHFVSLPFTFAVILSSSLILFPAIFLLGASTPLFISLQTKDGSDSGKVSGTVYAVSTLGGILSTFLCGFVMIPEFGLTITALFFGALLFLSSAFVLKLFKPASSLIILGLMCFDLRLFALPSDSLIESDGMMGKLEIREVVRKEGTVRLLMVNKIIQSEMEVMSRESVSEYVNVFSGQVADKKRSKKALILGLGGGLTSNTLVKKGYEVTGVEFDQRIIDASARYFYLHPSVKTVCDDARHFINQCEERFDLVLFDVFKAEEQPDHVLTSESLEKLKSILNKDAQVFVNWHGYLKGETGRGTSILYNTLVNAGFTVMLSSYSPDEDARNILFMAIHDPDSNIVSKDDTFVPDLYPTQEVNTDDRPILQKANAVANKRWRENYIRYYYGLK